jgi:hypothetical protein
VRHLVSQPLLRDFLAVDCHADQNETLCNDINDKLIDAAAIFKNDLTAQHISSFSPEFYPEESYARFFFLIECRIRIHEAKAMSFLGWKEVQCFVQPKYSDSGVTASKNMYLQVICRFDGIETDLKLLTKDACLPEDPKSIFQIFVSAIMLESRTQINIIEVADASERARWVHVLKLLPVHEIKDSIFPTAPPEPHQIVPVANPGACTIYISACRHETVSAGRNVHLYLSAIMDSLNRVHDPDIVWRFGNFMSEESSRIVAAQSKIRVFLLTGREYTLFGTLCGCSCAECVAVLESRETLSTRFVVLQNLSVQKLQPFVADTIGAVSFSGKNVSECISSEEYLKSSIIDAQLRRLFDEIKLVGVLTQRDLDALLPPHMRHYFDDCVSQFESEARAHVAQHFQG